jgi:hypothetical protein
MDPAVSSVLAARSASTASQVDFTLLRKALDMQKQAGAQIVEMIQQAAASKPQNPNGRLDLYA